MSTDVFVYTHWSGAFGQPRKTPLVLAYTRYQGQGACVHGVPDAKGEQAKQLAIKDHRARCIDMSARTPR